MVDGVDTNNSGSFLMRSYSANAWPICTRSNAFLGRVIVLKFCPFGIWSPWSSNDSFDALIITTGRKFCCFLIMLNYWWMYHQIRDLPNQIGEADRWNSSIFSFHLRLPIPSLRGVSSRIYAYWLPSSTAVGSRVLQYFMSESRLRSSTTHGRSEW